MQRNDQRLSHDVSSKQYFMLNSLSTWAKGSLFFSTIKFVCRTLLTYPLEYPVKPVLFYHWILPRWGENSNIRWGNYSMHLACMYRYIVDMRLLKSAESSFFVFLFSVSEEVLSFYNIKVKNHLHWAGSEDRLGIGFLRAKNTELGIRASARLRLRELSRDHFYLRIPFVVMSYYSCTYT
jgi:hypothetical protein